MGAGRRGTRWPPGWPARSRAHRLLTRIGSFVAVCVLVMLVPAAPAFAAGCTTAPTPEEPGQGIAGFFLPKPDPVPPDENPFAQGAKTTPFEQFGLAGLSWYLYDPGCGGAVRDPSGSISSWAGRTLFIPAKAGVASLVAVSGQALHPTFLQDFDPLLRNLTRALHSAVFTPLAPLAVMLTGLLLMARSTRQRVSESTTAVGWALLVMLAAAALFHYPTQAGRAADQVIGTGVGVVSRGLTSSDQPPAEQVANQLYNSFLYRIWLTGEFCDADSSAAKKYGPDILTAQALKWSEADRAAQQGSGSFVLAHQALFDQTATKVKKSDPVAYQCLAGHSSAPLESALLGDLGVLVMAPFLLIAGLILIAAYVIIRFAVMLGPALLTAGAFFPLRGVVHAALRVVAAALINSIVFTVCALFVIRIDTTVLDPGTHLPPWLRLVLLGVVTAVMWYLTRPFAKLTTMVTPRGFAESLAGAGAGWRARAGSLWRRTRAEEVRDAVEQVLDDEREPRRAAAEARVREEARGPVSLPHRLRVSAQRVPGAPGSGPVVVGPAVPGGVGAGAGALPGSGGPPGIAVPGGGPVPVRRTDRELPAARGAPLVSGRELDAHSGSGFDTEPGPVAGYGGGDEYFTVRPVTATRAGRAAPVEQPEPNRPTRQAEFTGPARVPAPVPANAEGLFDPAAPYRPHPEDSPPTHRLRHVRAQVVDGEEVYQLYDPGSDPLAGNDPWSR